MICPRGHKNIVMKSSQDTGKFYNMIWPRGHKNIMMKSSQDTGKFL